MTTTPRRPWPRAVLFDLDDTLWPIAPVILQAEQILFAWLADNAPRVAERFTIDSLRQARLELLAQRPEFQLDLGALRRAGLEAAFEQVGEDLSKVELAMTEFFAARNAVTPYDDVLPGLLRLKGKVLIGSVTNGNADLQTIGLAELTFVAVDRIATDFRAIEMFAAICVIYLALVAVLALLAGRLEARLQRPFQQ